MKGVFLTHRGEDDDEVVVFNTDTEILTEVLFDVVHKAVGRLHAESLDPKTDTITISIDENYDVVVFMLDGVWHDLRGSLTDKHHNVLGTWDIY